MWPFRQLRRRKLLRDALLPDTLWDQCLNDHPILAGLDDQEAGRLRELATLFIHEKIFEPVQGLELRELMKASIAVQACLPILNLGFDCYDDWRTVVVYPGEFVRPRAEFDTVGVMHEWEETLGGESWQRGPVILSWADVEASGWCDGYNVVIHEMAHKLDMRSGDADGFPSLHRDMKAREWNLAFTEAFEHLTALAERMREPDIDPYAAESPAEFFAVLSEYFFERPALVLRQYPKIYEQLRLYYRQDPARRLARTAQDLG